MEDHKTILNSALKEFSYADHLSLVLLPTVQDSGVYMRILRSCHSAIIQAMRAFLLFKKSQKKIGYVPDSFELIESIFVEKFSGPLGMGIDELDLHRRLVKMQELVQNSPGAIASPINTIVPGINLEKPVMSIEKMKNLLGLSRKFLTKIEDAMRTPLG